MRRSELRSARGGDRAVATPLVAISLLVLFVATSFTVDLGRLSERRRSLQLVADVAALDAARSMTGASASEQYSSVRLAAQQSAARNEHERGGAAVDVELLDGEGATLAETSATVPQAVRVEAHDDVRFLFQPGGRRAAARATAVPSEDPDLELTLGSGLLGIGGSWTDPETADRVDRQNALNGALLGSLVSLDVLHYEGLASTDVTLGELAVAAGLGTDVDALLRTDLSVGQVFELAARALADRGDPEAGPAIAALDALGAAVAAGPGLPPVQLGDLIVVDPATDESRYADLSLALDRFVEGTILLGRDGSVVTVPGLTAAIPGLTSLSIQLGIVEPARTVVGPTGTTVETAQVRVAATADVTAAGLASVHVPLVAQAAAARATVEDVRCANPETADVFVETTGAAVVLGTIGDLAADGPPAVTPARVVTLLGVIDVNAAGTVEVAGHAGIVTFGEGDWDVTRRIGDSPTLGATQLRPTLGLVGTVIDPVVVNALLGDLIGNVLAPTVNVLLTTVIEPILDLVGAQLAYADLTVSAPECRSSPRLIA